MAAPRASSPGRRRTPVVLLAVASACGPAPLFTTTTVQFRAPEPLPVDTVALLPAQLDTALEPRRAPIADSLAAALGRARHGTVVRTASSTAARLSGAHLVTVFDDAVEFRRRRRGEADSAALRALGQGLGARYLLFTDFHYADPGALGDRWLLMFAEVWDGRTGRVVWRARTESRDKPGADDGAIYGRRREIAELLNRGIRDLAARFLTAPDGSRD